MHPLKVLCGFVALLLPLGCGGSGGSAPSPPPTSAPPAVERIFDFSQGNGGWLSGFADYQPNTAPVDVIADIRTLPAGLAGSAYYLAGTNRSDDLFIYVKTRLGSLVPGVTYRVRATVDVLTDVPAGCIGVGGAPGESVWIVVAASAVEPQTIFTGTDYRVNIDRGNQSQSGPAGLVLGNIANSVPSCGNRRWESKSLSIPASATLTVRADDKGGAWLLVGMDSGFESFSRIYLQRLVVRLEAV